MLKAEYWTHTKQPVLLQYLLSGLDSNNQVNWLNKTAACQRAKSFLGGEESPDGDLKRAKLSKGPGGDARVLSGLFHQKSLMCFTEAVSTSRACVLQEGNWGTEKRLTSLKVMAVPLCCCSLHQQCRGVGFLGGLPALCNQGCGGEQREGKERQRGKGQQLWRVKPEGGDGTLRCVWVASQAKWAVVEVGERVGAVSCREPVFVLIQSSKFHWWLQMFQQALMLCGNPSIYWHEGLFSYSQTVSLKKQNFCVWYFW